MSFEFSEDGATIIKITKGDGALFHSNGQWQICIPKLDPDAECPGWMLAMTEAMLQLNDPEQCADLALALMARQSS